LRNWIVLQPVPLIDETPKAEVKRFWKVEVPKLEMAVPLIDETVKDDVLRFWKVEIVWLAGGG
jgi:hypothetical protein